MSRLHTGRSRSRQSQLSQLPGEPDVSAQAFITALTLEDVRYSHLLPFTFSFSFELPIAQVHYVLPLKNGFQNPLADRYFLKIGGSDR